MIRKLQTCSCFHSHLFVKILKSTKINFRKASKFHGKTSSPYFLSTKFIFQYNLYCLFSGVPSQLPGQKWNKVRAIFIKWQKFLNVISPDSRYLSILTTKLSTKGPPTICDHQFLVKIDPPLRYLSRFINFWWAYCPQLTSTSHNTKNNKSSDFMYNTQITIEKHNNLFLVLMERVWFILVEKFYERYFEMHKITNTYRM